VTVFWQVNQPWKAKVAAGGARACVVVDCSGNIHDRDFPFVSVACAPRHTPRPAHRPAKACGRWRAACSAPAPS
jgi:hypothetical protein